ncbi:MAG: phosphomannomutase/phosphoglucomutase [Pseudobdellovibrionaceae bacterium]
MYQDVIFREYDIRGVYQKEFDQDFAYLLGRAYAQYFFEKTGKKNLTITLGHDARVSSPEIKASMSKGLQDSGVRVLYIGLVTSPISYFTTFEVDGVDGAIMITGSHNPPEYNGFKISVEKSTIFGEEIQKIRHIIEKGVYVDGKGSEETFDIFPKYLERYKKEFGSFNDLKVVLDCGNGAAGCIVRRLFESLGLKPTILFEQPDGRFPNHHPDPTIEKNLKWLAETVRSEKAAVGIGFDGDADRIGVVDHTGKMLYGDELMVLISRAILAENRGAKIIGDVKCSDRLYEDIRKHGGEPIMWKTGHSLIKEKIKVEKAPFGGEMSGHIFFADRNYGYDDALYAGLRVCEILAKSGKSIQELMAGLPPSFNTPEIRIDTTEEKKVLIVEKLKSQFPTSKEYSTNLIDGVRISFNDGWALARASNTQPVLVLRFESWTKAGLDRIQSQIEATVNSML